MLFSRAGRMFPVVPFEGWSQAPRASLLRLLLCPLRCWREGTSSWGDGFHLVTQQAPWNLVAEACQSCHLHKCKRDRLSVMVLGDGHRYSVCPPSGHLLISLPILLMLSVVSGGGAALLGDVAKSLVLSPCAATGVFRTVEALSSPLFSIIL